MNQCRNNAAATEDRFRTMADGVPFMLWVQGPGGEQEFVNQACCEFFGVTREALLGRRWQRLVHPEDRESYVGEFLTCVRERRPLHAEARVKRADGQWRWVESFGNPRYSESGAFLGIVGTSPDITERKQAEQALRESEERFRLFMDNSPTIAWIKDEQGRHVYLSKTCEQRFGVRLDDWRGKTDAELWPPAIAEIFRNNDLAVLASDQAIDVVENTLNPDGSRCYWLNSKFTFRNTSGERMVAGIGLDITGRKQAEAALQAARAALERERDLLQAIMSGTRDAHLVYLDRDFNFVRVNEAYAATCGYTPEQMIGKNHFALYPHAENEAIFTRVRDTGIGVEFRDKPFSFPDQPERGTTYWDWTLTPDKDRRGEVVGLIFSLFETTQRVTAEKALRVSEERYRGLVETASEGIWQIDADLRTIDVNQRMAHMLGYSRQEIIGRRIHQFTTPEEVANVQKRAAARRMGVAEVYESRLLRKDGSSMDVQVSAAPLRDDRGAIIGAFGMFTDITERKRAEDALRASEQKFRGAFANAAIGFAMTTLDGCFVDANPAYCRLTGYSLQELRTLGFPQLIHPDDVAENLALTGRMLAGEIADYVVENRYFRKDGSAVWVRKSVSLVRNANGRPQWTIALVEDVSARKQAEDALRRLNESLENQVKERTASLVEANRQLEARARQLRRLTGELTMAEQRERKRLSKVLHDGLQQYLVAAKLQTGGLIEQCSADPLKRAATEIETLLGESIRVSRSLAAELSPPILHEAGLLAGLEWLSRWMSDKHGLKVELNLQMDAPVLAEDVKVLLFESLRELLLNVVKHARAGFARVHVCPVEDTLLRLTVSDDGAGFDVAGVIADASGGGFGLFSVRERIELVGGRFEMESAPGQGARFTLTVPLGSRESVGSSPSIRWRRTRDSAAARRTSDGKIRILLTDDHAVMREGLARLLAQEPDFEVVGQANDGKEAVEKAAALLPDVVLMDISMPEMDGIQATRIIRRQHPDMAVIGLSLYSEEERGNEMMEAGATMYMTKSGPPADLKAAIRACMRVG